MAEPVRARRLSDEEGRRLRQIVRRGKHGSVRVRRAMIIVASTSGTRLRQILHARGISFQRTRTWKDSAGPAARDLPPHPRHPLLRAGSHLCHGQPGPPQSPRTGPPAAGLPALAQRPRPPSRRPGRPAPRTGPHPQRAPATLGPPQAEGCMTGRQMWRQPPACWTAGSSPGRAQRRAMPRQTCLNGSPVWRCGTWTGPRCSSCHSPRSSRR
jgi:hypothetical protein